MDKRRPFRLFSLLLLAALLPAIASDTYSQDSEWRMVELPTGNTGLPSGTAGIKDLYRVDSVTARARAGGLLLETTDGGTSWHVLPAHWPTRFHKYGRVLVSFGEESGRVSRDSGSTWEQVTALFVNQGEATFATTLDGETLVASTKYRLGYSLDTGRTWNPLDATDSVYLFGNYSRRLDPIHGPFALPHPDSVNSDSALYSWLDWHLLSCDTIVVRLHVRIIEGGILADDITYTGLVSLRSQNVRWHLVDSSESVAHSGPGVGYAITSQPRLLRRTRDFVEWETLGALPSWLKWRDVRVLGSDTVVVVNGITTDGGRSWKPIICPYDPDPQYLCAFSSKHLLTAWNRGEIAWTTDGGVTWSRNVTGGSISSLDILGDTLVVALDRRALWRSTDGGLGWSDRGSSLPAELYRIVELYFVDTNRRSLMAALAVLRRGDTSLFQSIYSVDAGLTWSAGHLWNTAPKWQRWSPSGELGVAFSESRLFVSMDYGRSWQVRSDSIPGEASAPTFITDSLFLLPVQRGEMLRTTDGGRRFAPCAPESFRTQHFGSGFLRGIFTVPFQGQSRWRVYRSSDAGESWTRFETGATDISLNGSYTWLDTSTILFWASDSGSMYLSVDAGIRFRRIRSEDPPPCCFYSIVPYRSTLVGRSSSGHVFALYRLSNPRGPVAVRQESTPGVDPAAGAVAVHSLHGRVRYELPGDWAEPVLVHLVSACGRLVRQLTAVPSDRSGRREIILELSDVPSGFYLASLSSGGHQLSVPVLVMH